MEFFDISRDWDEIISMLHPHPPSFKTKTNFGAWTEKKESKRGESNK